MEPGRSGGPPGSRGEGGLKDTEIIEALRAKLAMFDLNCEAVDQRYGPGQAEKFRPLDYKFQYLPHANNFQALKSLRCWLYQCSEGNVPETELYKAFDEISAAICYGIVTRLPAYEAAQWD